MKAIAYSLFGWGKEKHRDCFEFNAFLRYMHLCVRFNRILYPEWTMIVNIDRSTLNSPYKPIFKWHEDNGFIKFDVQEDAPLCKAMLWRLKTVFSYTHPNWDFTHVICRDLDSLPSFREAQMVQEWVNEDKAMHCITDSISHNIPMMGGLVGFRPGYINDILKLNINPENAWEKLLSFATNINYNVKGSDQTFMNEVLYPKLCDNATEHFIKGMSHNKKEENGRHYKVNEYIDIAVDWNVKKLMDEAPIVGHAGAAGMYELPTMRFLHYHDPFKQEYEEIETMPEFSNIFYWTTREDLR